MGGRRKALILWEWLQALPTPERGLGRSGLAVLLTIAVLVGQTPPAPVTAMLAGLWTLLLVQTTLLLPRLDRRTRLLLAGQTPPPSHLHLLYVALEVVKVLLLPVLGVLLLAS